MDGAIDLLIYVNTSYFYDIYSINLTSSANIYWSFRSYYIFYKLVANKEDLNDPSALVTDVANDLYIPVTTIRSPGLALSTKSSSSIISIDLGSYPVGVRSGNSYIVNGYTSLNVL